MSSPETPGGINELDVHEAITLKPRGLKVKLSRR
ncbi:cytochrome P450 [Rhodococcus sp. LW-XY12]|nr:cytochrome P450 [Rhodococcus sp. LW-XY12]QXU56707.1 cytochrome P450 [Rhodococcus sp. LW-XY12]